MVFVCTSFAFVRSMVNLRRRGCACVADTRLLQGNSELLAVFFLLCQLPGPRLLLGVLALPHGLIQAFDPAILPAREEGRSTSGCSVFGLRTLGASGQRVDLRYDWTAAGPVVAGISKAALRARGRRRGCPTMSLEGQEDPWLSGNASQPKKERKKCQNPT